MKLSETLHDNQQTKKKKRKEKGKRKRDAKRWEREGFWLVPCLTWLLLLAGDPSPGWKERRSLAGWVRASEPRHLWFCCFFFLLYFLRVYTYIQLLDFEDGPQLQHSVSIAAGKASGRLRVCGRVVRIRKTSCTRTPLLFFPLQLFAIIRLQRRSLYPSTSKRSCCTRKLCMQICTACVVARSLGLEALLFM